MTQTDRCNAECGVGNVAACGECTYSQPICRDPSIQYCNPKSYLFGIEPCPRRLWRHGRLRRVGARALVRRARRRDRCALSAHALRAQPPVTTRINTPIPSFFSYTIALSQSHSFNHASHRSFARARARAPKLIHSFSLALSLRCHSVVTRFSLGFHSVFTRFSARLPACCPRFGSLSVSASTSLCPFPVSADRERATVATRGARRSTVVESRTVFRVAVCQRVFFI